MLLAGRTSSWRAYCASSCACSGSERRPQQSKRRLREISLYSNEDSGPLTVVCGWDFSSGCSAFLLFSLLLDLYDLVDCEPRKEDNDGGHGVGVGCTVRFGVLVYGVVGCCKV